MGDLNSLLRYFGVIRSSGAGGASDSQRQLALEAILKSIDMEVLKPKTEGSGMMRGQHKYPALFSAIKEVGGLDYFWKDIIVNLTHVTNANVNVNFINNSTRFPDNSNSNSPIIRDLACRIVAGVLSRLDSLEQASTFLRLSGMQILMGNLLQPQCRYV